MLGYALVGLRCACVLGILVPLIALVPLEEDMLIFMLCMLAVLIV